MTFTAPTFRNRSIFVTAAVLLAVSLLFAAFPVFAGVPSSGYFYIITGANGVECVDYEGQVYVYVGEVLRTAYVPEDNEIAYEYVNLYGGDESGTFGISAQGAPGAGAAGVMVGDIESNEGDGPVTLSISALLYVGGVLQGSSWLDITCSAIGADPEINLGDDYTETTDDTSVPATFRGPALPAPGARDLVLITGDYGVYSAPNGTPTGAVMHRCQTAFVIETSADGEWYRLYQMGGWVPVITTRDVAEDYGQPGGEPIDPFCR